MKKNISILMAILFTLSCVLFSSCDNILPEESDGEISKTDVSTYIPRDYLSEWSNKKLEVRVGSGVNDPTVMMLPSEIYTTNYAYHDEREIARRKAIKERYERRFNEYYKDRDLPNIITVDVLGETINLKRDTEFYPSLVSETKRDVSYHNSDGGHIRYTKDGIIAALRIDRSLSEAKKIDDNTQKVFNNFDEALECAKEFISKNVEIVEDFDAYTFTGVDSFQNDPTITYGIVFRKHINGIMVSRIYCTVNEYFGVCGFLTFDCEKDTMDFHISCAEYATTPEIIDAAKERLKMIAAENPDIVEIKDIKQFNGGRRKERYSEYEKVHYPAYEEYGVVNYYEDLDKTGVDLCFEYTAVMNDGTEKRGINVVTVFIPIDWAEEFGEK